MTLTLPEDIAAACAPLFQVLPIERAMSRLTGHHPSETERVAAILSDPALGGKPEIAAGLWLYVDDLERNHNVCQGIDTPTGAYWHGIMHRREGDFWNSRYWMRRAAGHPLLQLRPDLNPIALIDAVEAAAGADAPEFVERQRAEWQALFEWCAAQT